MCSFCESVGIPRDHILQRVDDRVSTAPMAQRLAELEGRVQNLEAQVSALLTRRFDED